jgi:hypothetical protein
MAVALVAGHDCVPVQRVSGLMRRHGVVLALPSTSAVWEHLSDRSAGSLVGLVARTGFMRNRHRNMSPGFCWRRVGWLALALCPWYTSH